MYPPKLLTKVVRVNRKEGTALIDSGCMQTLLKEGWAGEKKRGPEVLIQCVHGDVRGYPTGEVDVEIGGLRKRVKVGIAERLPYNMILGWDWPAFKQLVREDGEGECMGGEEKGSLSQEQREDPTLRHAWQLVSQNQGATRSGAWLILREGVLYRIGKDPKKQEEIDQLVLSIGKRKEALAVAHECPLAGHMRKVATTAKLLACVYWPGIYRDVKRYCETGGPC